MENSLNLSHESLKDLIGEKFSVNTDQGPEIELSLTDVGALKKSDAQTSFSAVFTAPPEVTPEPGVYRIRHKTKGDAEVFLSPFWADADSVKFEAVFNALN